MDIREHLEKLQQRRALDLIGELEFQAMVRGLLRTAADSCLWNDRRHMHRPVFSEREYQSAMASHVSEAARIFKANMLAKPSAVGCEATVDLILPTKAAAA